MRFPSLYFAFPILLSCFVTVVSYSMPHNYYNGVFLLLGIGISAIALDVILKIRLPKINTFEGLVFFGTREAFVALTLSLIVILFCVLDVTLFPIPLFVDPTTYATFDGGRDHIRHISDMSWVLPPIGLLCLRNKSFRMVFIAIGFIFPILVVDRNRLFAALFSFVMVFLLRRSGASLFPWKRVSALAISGGAGFSALGTLRSGTLQYIYLPFSNLFVNAPLSIKWILLYISAGTYNLSAIMSKGYINDAFLMGQILPMNAPPVTAATDIPLDAPTINIGTEFFPFLMAFGPVGVLLSSIALYILMITAVQVLKLRVSIFTILIFLRLAYVCVMCPFGPQAFTWTNFGFVFLCIFLGILAVLLPKRDLNQEVEHA